MGFLDNLFKKGTRNMTSSSVGSVAYNKNGTLRENETGDDEHCYSNVKTIRRRIEMVAAEEWPSYELRRDIPATEFGAGENDHGFDYGLYLDGQPKLMIMILDQYQYRNQSVHNAHAACKSRGVGSFHLLNHLPNRKTYIAERMKALMPQ